MEAFTLLSYWNGGGGAAAAFIPETAASTLRSPAGNTTTTIVTSVSETDAEADDTDADDEGPFFDLEFAVPEEDDEDDEAIHEVSDDDEEEPSGGGADGEVVGGDSDDTDGGGGEIKFTLSSCSGDEGRPADPNLALSPSDDLFFKGRLVAVEPPSSAAADRDATARAPAAQLSASLLKSATKFRVFMLGLKKSKINQAKLGKSESNSGFGDGDGDGNGDKQQSTAPPPPSQQKDTLAVKLKVEEVPIISLFSRDSSSRNSSTSSSSSSSSSSFSKKPNGNESAVSDEKRFVMMQKYLKKMKPLYIRVSRRYGEKLRFSGQLSVGSGNPVKSTAEAPTKSQKPPGSINIKIPAGLKVVKKHLGKSRSSSSATPPPPPPQTTVAAEKSGRRDDSLLLQQDGIQSAILHCKRSFNSSRDGDPSVLARSVSDPSSESNHEKIGTNLNG